MRSLAKVSVFMMGILAASKLLAFLRDILLASKFGTSIVVDAYSVACILPTVMFTVFASGFSNSYIPVLARLQNEDDRKKLFSNAICVLGICAIVLSFICYFFSTSIVSVIAPGFYGEVASLTASFIEIIIFYLPFYTIFSIFCAKSSADEDFFFVSFCNNIIVNLVILFSVAIADQAHSTVLAYGYVVSMVAATIFLGVRLKKRGQKFSWCFQPRDSTFQMLAGLAIPMGLSSLGNQVNAVVDKMFSSTLGEGATSVLVYADHLQLVPYSLVVSVLISVCNPRINKFFAEGNKERGIYYARKTAMLSLYFLLPITVFLLAYSIPLVELLLKRGEFGDQSVFMTAGCLFYYSLGMPFYAIRQITAHVLMANLKQVIVLKNTIINAVLNIILNFIFVGMMGYSGLALATSIAGVISAIYLVRHLQLMGVTIFRHEEIGDGVKIVLSSIIAIIFCKIIVHLFSAIMIEYLVIILAVIMVVVFFLFSHLFDIKVYHWVFESFVIYIQNKL